MIKRLAILTVLSFSAATLHAIPINGSFAAFGADEFTSSTIEFGAATVQPAILGTFAAYLTTGNAITFIPGVLPYTPGGTQIAPPGLPAFFTTTENGETFSFFISSYNATYIASGTGVGCANGNTCLDVTGTGTFTGTGVVNYDTSTADFQFDSSYVPGEVVGLTQTTFAAQTNATGVPPVPEPASLALFGSGLLGVVGLARRKFRS